MWLYSILSFSFSILSFAYVKNEELRDNKNNVRVTAGNLDNSLFPAFLLPNQRGGGGGGGGGDLIIERLRKISNWNTVWQLMFWIFFVFIV